MASRLIFLPIWKGAHEGRTRVTGWSRKLAHLGEWPAWLKDQVHVALPARALSFMSP
jgi:hypothetical protein